MVLIRMRILVTFNIQAKCPKSDSGRIILCNIQVLEGTVIHGMLISV
jgi:hypothetical protein